MSSRTMWNQDTQRMADTYAVWAAGCDCKIPLIFYRPARGPCCRLCGVEALTWEGSEFIAMAAIRWHNVNYSAPPPLRHHDVCRLMTEEGLGPEAMHNQGFITSRARFVDRKVGLEIAWAALQLKGKVKVGNPDLLWSEDLW